MSTKRARNLRKNATDAECRLWSRLRRNRLDGHHFRRQVPIGPYITDFVCASKKLIVEADGGQHAAQKAHDEARTSYLEDKGYRMLRFWNNDILGNTDGVVETILLVLSES